MDPKAIIDNFVNIVTKKYFCFTGRADRKEFWQYVLVTFIVGAVLGLIPVAGRIISIIYFLALLLPSLGVGARRLHDTGKTGLLLLLALIPVVGALLVLILCIPEGSKESNAYGDPIA